MIKTEEVLMIKKVRTWKKAIFLFETIGSTGKQPLECFYYHDKQLKWNVINYSDLESSYPTKKEFVVWKKLAMHLRESN